MLEHYITAIISFIVFFLIGLGLSLKPAVVMAGIHSNQYMKDNGKLWISYGLFIAILFVINMLGACLIDCYSVYMPLTIDFSWGGSQWWQVVSIILFVILILQELRIVDFSHGERNLAFRYEQLDKGLQSSSWEEKYMLNGRCNLAKGLADCIYMLRMPIRSTWPYLVWILFGYPQVISYLLMGYVWGHIMLHDRQTLERLSDSGFYRWLAGVPVFCIVMTSILLIVMAMWLLIKPVSWPAM